MKTRFILIALFSLLVGAVIMGAFNIDPMQGTTVVSIAVGAIVGGLKSSKELKEEKGKIWERAQGIVATAKEEKRAMSEDDLKDYDKLMAEMRELDDQIKRAEEFEKRSLEMAGAFINKENEKREKKEVKKYSFVRAIRMKAEGRELDGFEAEMHQEAKKESRENGVSINGIGIPSIIMDEKRDLSVGTDSEGGYTVETSLVGFIPALRAKMMTTQLGAQMMTGLVGDVDIPRQATASSAAWEGENDAGAEQSPTFEKISLSPNRLGGYSEISKQLIQQSSIDVENFVRNDLIMAIKLAIDLAAINGSGASNQPTGILNTTGIGSVAGGTDGAAPTYANLVNLEREVAVDNADLGNLAFLTNPKVRAKLKQTALDSGSGLFVWPQKGNEILGYNAGVSTQVPSNLTKGSGTSLSAIIFGNWNDLIIGQWGGLDIVVDPYTLATTNMLRVVVNSWWDVALRHPESFAAMVDAITA